MRRRTTWMVLGIAAVLLAGGAVAADRAGLASAKSTAADEVAEAATEQHFTYSGKPEITMHGSVFLPQMLRGTYDKVTTVLHDVNSSGLTLPVFTTVATGVTDGIAANLVGTGTVGYETLAAVFGVPGLSVSGTGGKVLLRLPVELAPGMPKMEVTVTGDLKVAGGKAAFAPTEVTAKGAMLPPEVVAQFKQQFSREIAVPPLPYTLVLQQARATDTGLEIMASARGVTVAD